MAVNMYFFVRLPASLSRADFHFCPAESKSTNKPPDVGRRIVIRIPKVFLFPNIFINLSYLLSTWLTIERSYGGMVSAMAFRMRDIHFCIWLSNASLFCRRTPSRRRTKCSPQGTGCFHRSPRDFVRASSGACFFRLFRMRVWRIGSCYGQRDNVGRFEIICLRKQRREHLRTFEKRFLSHGIKVYM